jgi:hypothetical protein
MKIRYVSGWDTGGIEDSIWNYCWIIKIWDTLTELGLSWKWVSYWCSVLNSFC